MVIYLDSADLSQMVEFEDRVQGFTTNPTLIRKARVSDYLSFARMVSSRFCTKPISLEVISDDFSEMERQAKLLASLGSNVIVKIPITNSKGESSLRLIERLEGIPLNITAVFTVEQARSLIPYKPAIVSIFAGRIADTGVNPQDIVYEASWSKSPESQILWASAREILNFWHASEARADIITLNPELLSKLHLKGKDLTEYSKETAAMFYNDAQKAGYVL